MKLPTDPAERRALYERIIARGPSRSAPLTDADREYLEDRAYDQCKVSADEVAAERESWR